MTKKKIEELEIDCIKMKEEAQARVLKARRKDLTPAEEAREAEERMRRHPVFGAWWRRQMDERKKQKRAG